MLLLLLLRFFIYFFSSMQADVFMLKISWLKSYS